MGGCLKKQMTIVLLLICLIISSTFIVVAHEKKDAKNTIYFSNMKKFKVTDYFSAMTDKEIKGIQKSIDKGNAVVTFNELDNFDGKLSYIAGHNPGIMSEFAKFVKKDREVCIYDKNGKKRYYTLQFLAKQKKSQRDANKEVNDLIKEKDKKEAVLFQFCVGKEIHFWLATPKK